MHIYFIGINGAGMSALAHFALDADYHVSGSDLQTGANTEQLKARGATINRGDTTQNIQEVHAKNAIDMVVFSSAIPGESSELQFAKEQNLPVQKRGPFINWLLDELKLNLVAIAGTHGKTTTSAMVVWIMQQLKQPVSHIIGTNLGYANAGAYQKESDYLILEADEYDRLMLDFEPAITTVISLDYDHPDIYKSEQEYIDAFTQLCTNSQLVLTWSNIEKTLKLATKQSIGFDEGIAHNEITLHGEHNRSNAWLAANTVNVLINNEDANTFAEIIKAVNTFPGSGRRFEQIADYVYSDYGHSPAEIKATLQLASEVADANQRVVAVYQPHQNIRQHLVRKDYKDAFTQADAIYWLPTYLSREDPDLEVLRPQQLIDEILNKEQATPVQLDDNLSAVIKKHQANGDLVVLFGAGSIDDWARKKLL